jgi:SpoVK/Ycf46/Vps4 family AAA+-type ATPase
LFILKKLEQRRKILQVILKDETLSENLDLGEVARQTENFSGSDLHELCRYAAMNAFIKTLKAVRGERTVSIIKNNNQLYEDSIDGDDDNDDDHHHSEESNTDDEQCDDTINNDINNPTEAKAIIKMNDFLHALDKLKVKKMTRTFI